MVKLIKEIDNIDKGYHNVDFVISKKIIIYKFRVNGVEFESSIDMVPVIGIIRAAQKEAVLSKDIKPENFVMEILQGNNIYRKYTCNDIVDIYKYNNLKIAAINDIKFGKNHAFEVPMEKIDYEVLDDLRDKVDVLDTWQMTKKR